MTHNKIVLSTMSSITTPWAAPKISTSEGTIKYIATPTPTSTPTRTWSNDLNNNNNNLTNQTRTFNFATNNNSVIISNELDDISSDSEFLRTIEYIGTVLSFYYVPIIVGTGSIGNLLSVFVFFKTKLRKLSSSFYLAALAISDTCFLFGLFVQWLNFVDIHIYNREYFCQFFTFFSNLACFCSVWFVVAFTVERFIAVMYPLRRQTMCTVRRAKMVIILLTVLGCLHCIPFWISSTPVYSPKLETTICDIKSEYKDYITLLNYWDTIVVFAVPFATIAILNTCTGCTVWKFATVRRTLTMQKLSTQHLSGTSSSADNLCSMQERTRTIAAANRGAKKTTKSQKQEQAASTYHITTSYLKRKKSTTCTNSIQSNGQHNCIINQHYHHHHHHPQQQHHQHQCQLGNRPMNPHPKQSISGNCVFSDRFRKKTRRKSATNTSQLKVTKMLLIVSTVFVCLNLPSFIMRMITYLETQTSTNEKTTVVLQYIFQLLFITNFGINFVLYCVSGQNFRKAVVSIFRKASTTQRDGTSQITVSEYYRNNGGVRAACGTTTSMRRRMISKNYWNETHELQLLN